MFAASHTWVVQPRVAPILELLMADELEVLETELDDSVFMLLALELLLDKGVGAGDDLLASPLPPPQLLILIRIVDNKRR